MSPKWWGVILIGVYCLVPSLDRSASAEGDAIEWRPPAKPVEFRKLLPDAEYQRRAAPYLGRLPAAQKEEAGKLPDHGLQLSGVMEFGFLGAQGVTTTDVIERVDGKELWGRWPMSRRESVSLRVFSPRQCRSREIKVATDLDHRFSVYRRPDLAYLRNKSRNAAWDRDAFIGLTTAASAPDIAETAWHRAIAAGFPRTRPCLTSGASSALAQGHPEAALDFWYEAEHASGADPLDPLLAYRVMIANHKLEQARDLARRHPELLPRIAAGLEPLIAMHRGRSARDRAAPTPSLQAKALHRRDARGFLIGRSPLAENQFLDRLTRRHDFQAAATSDHFSLVELSSEQGLANFDASLALTMTATDNQRAKFVKLVRLILLGSRKSEIRGDVEPALIAHVELKIPSGFSLRSFEPGDAVYFPDSSIATDGKGRNSVRILRVGGQLEISINDRRVLHQPVLPEIPLRQIQLQAVGTTVDVTDFTLDELIPRL